MVCRKREDGVGEGEQGGQAAIAIAMHALLSNCGHWQSFIKSCAPRAAAASITMKGSCGAAQWGKRGRNKELNVKKVEKEEKYNKKFKFV